MPIIGLNGKVIKEEDIGFLTEMLRGSLENHIYHLTEWQRTAAARAKPDGVKEIIQAALMPRHKYLPPDRHYDLLGGFCCLKAQCPICGAV